MTRLVDRDVDFADLDTAPFMVLRRAGISIRHLERLVFAYTLPGIDALLDLEDSCRMQASAVLAELERTIGCLLTSGAVRQELIQLRRDIFNDRVPRTLLTAAADAALAGYSSPEMRNQLAQWLQYRRRRETLSVEARCAFARELDLSHVLLPRLFRLREFRRGLSLASTSLSEALDRYLQQPVEAVPRRRRIERGVLRYSTRAAFKLSPFSTFTRVRLVKAAVAEMTTAAMGLPVRIHRRVLLNRALIGHIAAAVSRHPDLAGQVPVYRASSAEVGSLVLVTHRYEDTGPNRARVPRESLVRLRSTRTLAAVWSYLDRHGGSVSLHQLTVALGDMVGDRARAAEYIRALIDIGGLIHQLPLPDESPAALARLLAFLRESERPFGRTVQQLLESIDVRVGEYATAITPAARREILSRINNLVSDTLRTLGDDPKMPWDGLLVYEDCIERPHVDGRPLNGLRSAVHDLHAFVDLYAMMLDGNVAVRETIRHVLKTEFGGGPVPLLTFAARYHQLCSSAHLAYPLAEAAYTLNPLQLPQLHALAELRREFAAVMTAHTDDENQAIALDSVAAAALWPERLAALGLAQPMDGAHYLETYCHPLPGDGERTLVVNKIQPGPCRALLRACAGLPGDGDGGAAGVASAVRSWLTSHRSETRLFELRATFDYNANIAPRVFDRGIDYLAAPERGPHAAGLGDLHLSLSKSGNGQIVLTRGRATDATPIVPVVFGTMATMFQPPLEHLLVSLGTCDPVLYRVFDPHSWSTGDMADAPLLRFPRLICGRCILRRRAWSVPRRDLPLRTPANTEFDHFVLVRRWQRQIGLPDEVFVRTRSFTRRRANVGELANPRYRVLHKPQYVHFGNYLLVDLFDQLLRQSGDRVYIEEALPSSKHWAELQRTRAEELVIDSLVRYRPCHRPNTCTVGTGFVPITSSAAKMT